MESRPVQWEHHEPIAQIVKVAVPSEKWSHLVGTCDGKSVILYLNGQPVDKVALPNGMPVSHSQTPLMIGGEPNGYLWSGKMDKAALYGRALSAEEVNLLFEAEE